ncbi:MAG: right-handed parallel beta-helix repeat-containing protein [Opitutae bacterium]|nr:right-handed parallel beta-helix repeat-containing protein [Opitutae bacterium]
MKKFIGLVAASLLLAIGFTPAHAAILQVGTNWPGSPYPDVQSAVDAAAESGDEIWVEQGTYLLTNTIAINKSLAIYGGFDGAESAREERDWANQPTLVDGNDVLQPLGGCFHVAGASNAAVTIDGLIITRGYADRGGGIRNGYATSNTFGDLTVANCILTNNHGATHAGGIFNDWGDLTVTDCTFTGNYAGNKGGAILNYGHDMTLSGCTIASNRANNGGAISYPNTAGSPSASNLNTFTDCVFSNNEAASDGSALLIDGHTVATRCVFVANTSARYGTIATYADAGYSFAFANCLFARNTTKYGGALCINGSAGILGAISFMNCTITSNTTVSGGAGGAIYTRKPSTNENSVFSIQNSIVWGANTSSNEIDRSGATQPLPAVAFSLFDQPGYAGSMNDNVAGDPLFADASAGDYHLAAGSPCLNTGTASGAPAADLDGTPRPQGAGFDMGAYELAAAAVETLSAANVTATSAALLGDLTSTGGAPTTVYAYWGEDLVDVLPITVDTYIDSFRPTNNYGTNGSAKVVASATPARTLFKLPEDLWTNDVSQIVSATVSFYVWNDSTGTQDMYLHPLTRAFTEDGATWNTYDGANAWTAAGGDYNSGDSVLAVKGVAGVYSNDANGKFFTWDIMPLLTNPATRAELQNYGALLDAGTADPQKFASFNSSDKTGYPQSYLPALTLVRANGAPDQSANLGVLAEGTFTNAVGDLQPNTSYTFTFLASNAAGIAWAPAAGAFTTLAAAPAIENADASDLLDQSATLNATLTSDGGQPTFVSYAFGTDPASWTVTQLSGAYPEGGVNVAVSGLAPATTYYFQFMASNATGTAWAPATNSFTTPYGVSMANVTFSNGVMVIDIDGLSGNVTNVVERSFNLESNDWTVVTNLVGSGATNWFEEPSPDWTNMFVFYRIRLAQ